jgi:hypothetical protein
MTGYGVGGNGNGRVCLGLCTSNVVFHPSPGALGVWQREVKHTPSKSLRVLALSAAIQASPRALLTVGSGDSASPAAWALSPRTLLAPRGTRAAAIWALLHTHKRGNKGIRAIVDQRNELRRVSLKKKGGTIAMFAVSRVSVSPVRRGTARASRRIDRPGT